jgi:2-dehydro-3-deoxyphosphooctonate aldolase (KDO 8-P synthase)
MTEPRPQTPDVAIRRVQIGDVTFASDRPLALIMGPCAIQDRDHALQTAERLRGIAEDLGLGLVYKSSFDKANRSSAKSYRGVGLDAGLEILSAVKRETGLPVLTDVHEPAQCAPAAGVVDALQIPAFLCRQTDLLLAAAATGKPVNVKKGQFMAPWDADNIPAKLSEGGNDQCLLTERGVSFGYNTLVSDMRGLPVMAQRTGCPVVFDATHSVQQPGGQGTTSGGQREFVPVLARAAVAVGVAGVFMETHEDPANAPSDGPNMVSLDDVPAVLRTLKALDEIAKANPVRLA